MSGLADVRKTDGGNPREGWARRTKRARQEPAPTTRSSDGSTPAELRCRRRRLGHGGRLFPHRPLGDRVAEQHTAEKAGQGHDTEEAAAAQDMLPLHRPAPQLEISSQRRAPASPLQQPEQRHGGQDRRTHHQERRQILKEQHPVDDVVAIEAGGAEAETETGADQRAGDVEAVHRAPPVARWSSQVAATAVTMKVPTATMLPGERVEEPEMPWPEVQAPAQRAPKPRRTLPASSTGIRAPGARSWPSRP